MPRKKKLNVTPLEPDKVYVLPEEVTEEIAEKLYVCNHHNAHYTSDELRCTLPNGHEGNHSARLNGKLTEWSDAAGTPARKHA